MLSVEVISIAAGGAATGNGPSPSTESSDNGFVAAVSDDGRYVAFTSNATDLVAGLPVDASGNVYVRDRQTGAVVCASVDAAGNPIGDTSNFGMSGDGRYVAFSTFNPGFPGDDPPVGDTSDVFVRDLVARTTTLVNHTPAGAPTQAEAYFRAISRNGRYVVFSSDSTELVPGVTNFGPNDHFFRYDVQTGDVQFVTDRFTDTDAPLGGVQLSDDGERVAYVAPTDIDFFSVARWNDYNVFVKDFTTGQTTTASLGSAGQQIDMEEGSPNAFLDYRLSGDGRHVAFVAMQAGFTPDTSDLGYDEVYARDLVAGTTTLVTRGATGPAAGNDFVGSLEISDDGRYVLFESARDFSGLPDLNGSEDEPMADVYRADLQAGTIRLVSSNVAGTGELGGWFADMSRDGRYVVYETDQTGVLPDDVDFLYRIVLRDLVAGGTTLLNRRPDGTTFDYGESTSANVLFSRSGNLVLFNAGPHEVGATFAPGVTDANGAGDDLLAMPLAGLAAPPLSPPAAAAGPLPLVISPGGATYEFDVTFSDAYLIDPFVVEGDEIVVTGPGGFRQAASMVGFPPEDFARTVTAHYSIPAPGGAWGPEDNALYTVEVLADQVRSTSGLAVPAGPVAAGVFGVDVPLPNGPDLEATALAGAVPPAVVGGPGTRQKIKPLALSVTNSGNQPAVGVVTVRLVASADAVADPGDAVVVELAGRKLKLAPGKSKVFKLKPASFPAVADGDYRLLAVVDAGGVMTERRELNNSAALAAPVRIAAPFVDLGLSSPALTGRPAAGKKATLLVTAANGGNQDARGVQAVRVRLTTNPADPGAVSRAVDTTLKLNLKPGATKALRAKLTLPTDLPAGSYIVVVELLAGAPWTDPNAANDVATSAGAYAV
jgi:Tol biopolymer transport system component